MIGSVMVIQSDLEFMENALESDLQAIEDEVDLLVELAQRKAEKLRRVREMMDEYLEMREGE